jgi:outer membrane immunogenic protein
MRAPLLALMVAFTAVSAVHAADFPSKAVYKTPSTVAVATWSGFYVGAGIGARWTDSDWTTTAAFDPTGAPTPFTTDPNGAFSNAALRLSGYAGYNWQVSPTWVLGLEGDFGWANNHGTLASRIPGLGALNTGSFAEVKGSWDASVRGRAGYLVTPHLLAYATGGVAVQHMQAITTCPAEGVVCSNVPGANTLSFSNSSDRVGWTVGGGLETNLTQNWLARVEYRYSDFGNFSFVAIPSTPFNGVAANFGANANLSTTTHIVTLGLAYKFDGPY